MFKTQIIIRPRQLVKATAIVYLSWTVMKAVDLAISPRLYRFVDELKKADWSI